MSEVSERSRLDSIVQMLKINTSASIGEIAETFHVSQMTIRRDLEKLVEAGQVIRIPGGARIEYWRGAERSFFERLQKMSGSKRSIGAAAAALVKDGESVVLDSGTTTLYVARELLPRRNVVVRLNTGRTDFERIMHTRPRLYRNRRHEAVAPFGWAAIGDALELLDA